MTRAHLLAKLLLLGLLTGCLEQTLLVSDQQGMSDPQETDDDREDGPDASDEQDDERDDDAGRTRADASRSDGSPPRSCERCGNFDMRRCSPLNPEPQWAFCVECGCCFGDRDCAFPGRDWVCVRPLGSDRTQPGRCVDPSWTTTP